MPFRKVSLSIDEFSKEVEKAIELENNSNHAAGSGKLISLKGINDRLYLEGLVFDNQDLLWAIRDLANKKVITFDLIINEDKLVVRGLISYKEPFSH